VSSVVNLPYTQFPPPGGESKCNRDVSPVGFPTTSGQTRGMERAPDTLHSKCPHVYPIVRIDTPIDQSDPTQKITVAKVLTSQSDAEAEV